LGEGDWGVSQHDMSREKTGEAPLKLQDRLAYPPRAMRADRAAAYLAMSQSKFLALVEEGRMPPPIPIDGMVTWDRFELDAAYEEFKEARDGRPDEDGRPPGRNMISAALGIEDEK
jgi:predicted DNA-binding transcriptional regulator AlpA